MNASDSLKRLGMLEVRIFPRKGGLPTVCEVEDLPDYEIVERRIKEIDELSVSFGVDAITLLTALSKGVFYKTIGGQIIWAMPSLHCLDLSSLPALRFRWCLCVKEGLLLFKELGEKWALTKEELEEK